MLVSGSKMWYLWCQLFGMDYEHGGTCYFEILFVFYVVFFAYYFSSTVFFGGFSCSYLLSVDLCLYLCVVYLHIFFIVNNVIIWLLFSVYVPFCTQKENMAILNWNFVSFIKCLVLCRTCYVFYSDDQF